MSNDEIEYFLKSDLTWHKSKKFWVIRKFFNLLWNNALEDKLNIFNSKGFRDFKKSNLSSKEKDALDILDLNYTAKWQEIQQNLNICKEISSDKNHGSKNLKIG